MKLYWSPNSPCARQAVFVIEEMQIDHCVEFIETASAETGLSPGASATKTASSRLTARQRFEQRLGRLCGPIDGIPIAIDPRNDEAALHDGNEHQRKLRDQGASQFHRRLELGGELPQGSPGVRGNSVRRASSTRARRWTIRRQICPSCNL